MQEFNISHNIKEKESFGSYNREEHTGQSELWEVNQANIWVTPSEESGFKMVIKEEVRNGNLLTFMEIGGSWKVDMVRLTWFLQTVPDKMVVWLALQMVEHSFGDLNNEYLI